MKGRYTATKKGVKKGYRILKDKATALKKSVTCKKKKSNLSNKMLLTSQYNGYVKNNSKITKKKFLKQKQTKDIRNAKDRLYKRAGTIKTGVEPNASMKMQMRQNYSAYLQNNSKYKSYKSYEDVIRNKTLKDDLTILESQLNIAITLIGGGGYATKSAKQIISKNGYNFSKTAIGHMNDPNRRIPVEIIKYIIEEGKSVADPRGSKARMYYSTISRNGNLYNVEVLYDIKTNTIFHFKYSPKSLGILPAIKAK